MEDAELSGIEEDVEEMSTAPGKENENPKPFKGPKASRSFMLKNCGLQTKTTSDASSEASIPLRMIKAMQLSDDGEYNSAGGGARLSAGSDKLSPLQSSTIDSVQVQPQAFEEAVPAVGTSGVDGDGRAENVEVLRSSWDEQASSATFPVPSRPTASATSSPKKKVHWMKFDEPPLTVECTQPYNSDSGFSSGYRSDVSMRTTGSRGRRHNPGDISKGSPPEREGVATVENIGGTMDKSAGSYCSNLNAEINSNDHDFGSKHAYKTLHRQHEFNAAHPPDSSQSMPGLQGTMPPTPPGVYDQMNAAVPGCDDSAFGHDAQSYWAYNPHQPIQEFPNYSRPYHSPSKSALGQDQARYANPVSSPGYGTRPDYHAQPYAFQSSSHFSDSTTRRDFSGFEAPGFDLYSSPEAAVPETSSWLGEHPLYGKEACGGYSSFQPSGESVTFDFSHLYGTGFGGDGDCEKFVRSKKQSTRTNGVGCRDQTSTTHSWRLYDDGDADDCELASDHAGACEWKDGRTTLHRSDRAPKSGNVMKILSIREIQSDEEVSSVDDKGRRFQKPNY